MMRHMFDTGVAAEVGVNAAVLLENIAFWCAKNAANGRHYHDGLNWTYNSTKAFTELFPYLTAAQIRTALKKLEGAGYIVKGHHSENQYDRTAWYAATEKAFAALDMDVEPCDGDDKSICEKRQMEMGEKTNDYISITDINTDSKPDIKGKRFSKPTVEEVAAYIEDKGYKVDAGAFIDYYESVGWTVGKKPMRDWRAAVRTWDRKDRAAELKRKPPTKRALEVEDAFDYALRGV